MKTLCTDEFKKMLEGKGDLVVFTISKPSLKFDYFTSYELKPMTC